MEMVFYEQSTLSNPILLQNVDFDFALHNQVQLSSSLPSGFLSLTLPSLSLYDSLLFSSATAFGIVVIYSIDLFAGDASLAAVTLIGT
ncbi:hypothetical protein SDJN03_15242, partial [Cucurbita argyrosperma subsp. sororia]